MPGRPRWPACSRGMAWRSAASRRCRWRRSSRGFVAWQRSRRRCSRSIPGRGAFYRLMPHNAMVAIFGAAFLYAIVAMVMGMRAFWRDIGAPAGTLAAACLALAGREGCRQRCAISMAAVTAASTRRSADRPAPALSSPHVLRLPALLRLNRAWRRVYHYLLGRPAPYPWYDLPVVLGTLGGIGLIIGPVGLMAAKCAATRSWPTGRASAWTWRSWSMLFLTSLTGLALLALRETAAMGSAGAASRRGARRCFSPFPTGNSCTASTASWRWCATPSRGARLGDATRPQLAIRIRPM